MSGDPSLVTAPTASIVDAYTLVGSVTLRPESLGFEQLFEGMRKRGVSRSAVISLRALHADARKGNADLFRIAHQDPRIIPIGVLGPQASTLETEALLGDCLRNEASALAFPVTDGSFLSSLSFRKTLEKAAATGLPLVACGVIHRGIPSTLAALTRDLHCPLLLAGTSYLLFDELLAVLEEHRHVYADCSWVPTPGAIELLLRHAGRERILFASGSTLRPIQPALNTVLDAEIEEQDKRRILGVNALRFFGQGQEADQLEAAETPLPELRIPSTPAIDVHTHLGTIPGISATIRDLSAIEYFSSRFNMEYSICSSYVAYHEDLDAGNQEMLDAIDGRPRLLGSPVISPTHLEASIRWLDRCSRDPKLPHATLTMETVREEAGAESFLRLFEAAAKRQVPIFLNGPTWDEFRLLRWPRGPGYAPFLRAATAADLEMFLEIGRRHPDLPVILGHGLGKEGIELARQRPNFYLELSGTYPDRGDVRRAIDAVGKEQVVFGTDLDLIVPAFALGIYYEADLSAEEDRLIMAENARRILRLPGTA